MANDGRKTEPSCPLCDGVSRVAFEKDGHDISDCVECSHRFATISEISGHLENVYSDSYFTGGGAGYSDYLAEESMLIERGSTYSKLIESTVRKKGMLLDVGAAAGCIMQGFAKEGWRCVGLEPNALMVEEGKRRFGSDIRQGALEEFETEERFELVTMIQVAGHFVDPKKAFANAYRLLKPGAHLLIETWDRNSKLASLFGKNWHEYSPPSVLHWWSEKSLTEFLETKGFEKIAGGRPSKKISGEHARSLLEYKIGNWSALKLIPSRLNIPYPAEDLFWALFRKPV